MAGYAAVVAEVEVAENVRVLNVWCAADDGLAINPDGAINQLEGGIIQGISWALKKGVRLDTAGISSRDWESYPVLRFTEVPELFVELINPLTDLPPLGLGEATGGPTVAAMRSRLAKPPSTPNINRSISGASVSAWPRSIGSLWRAIASSAPLSRMQADAAPQEVSIARIRIRPC